MLLESCIPRSPRSSIAAWLLVLVVLSGVRFAYALFASPAGWSAPTYMEIVYDNQSRVPVAEDGLKRRWGPLFLVGMDAAARLPIAERTLRISVRLALLAMYAATIALLAGLFRGVTWRLVLIALALQSSAAIYAISSGMGEVVLGICSVGHFVLFVKRRYRSAALLICGGIYFKLLPVIFAFPYFLFSLLSRDHRRYARALVASGILVALASVPVSGWAFGFLYPLSMVGSVMTDADLLPVLSKEVFGVVSLISRFALSFRVQEADPHAVVLAKSVASLAGVLLIVSTAAGALLLRRDERVWRIEPERRLGALLVFQSAIGFLVFALSPDVSVTHMLPLCVSLYAPLWLMSRRENPADRWQMVSWLVYAVGLALSGNLIPLSILYRALPLAWLDQMAGNAPAALIVHEKYIWYGIPMIGVLLVAVAFGRSFLRTTPVRTPGPALGESGPRQPPASPQSA